MASDSKASPDIRAQVAALCSAHLDGELDWGDFLQALPEGIGGDAQIQELIALLKQVPPPTLVSEEAFEQYLNLVLDRIAKLKPVSS